MYAAWYITGAYKDSERRHEVNEIRNEKASQILQKDMEVVKKDMEVAMWKAEAKFMASKVRIYSP